MNAQSQIIPAWLTRLLTSPAVIPKPKPRCECGRFCKQDKPDITDKLVKDMSAAGLYVPPRFALRGQDGQE